jgi:predicted dithiol-disulfide oxidoreductase (DUF899 family)
MSTTTTKEFSRPDIVSSSEWTAARKELLKQEKEYTHLRDKVSAQRRKLPWVLVEKNYVFDGPQGKVTLADLFRGRSQLIVQHFMMGPGWEEGCRGCSFMADHVDGARQHFEHHDVAFAAVSRAPWSEIEKFKKRMGWGFNWASSYGSDFNYDYHVSFTKEQLESGKVYYNFEEIDDASMDELPGLSVFQKEEDGRIYHTYSSYSRGCEELLGAYMFLDLTPKGRNETQIMDWMNYHDRYEEEGSGTCCGGAKETSA